MDADLVLDDAGLRKGSPAGAARDPVDVIGAERVKVVDVFDQAQLMPESFEAAKILRADDEPPMTAPAIRRSLAGEATKRPLCRPGWGKTIWYCYGGSLPARHSTWVLNDVTCRTWVVRHFARWTMVVVPVFVLFMAFLPSPFGIRLFTGITVSLGIFMFALVNILIDTDRRAVRAGYSFKFPGEIRGARAVDHQRLANQERRERGAARRARRGR